MAVGEFYTEKQGMFNILLSPDEGEGGADKKAYPMGRLYIVYEEVSPAGPMVTFVGVFTQINRFPEPHALFNFETGPGYHAVFLDKLAALREVQPIIPTLSLAENARLYNRACLLLWRAGDKELWHPNAIPMEW